MNISGMTEIVVASLILLGTILSLLSSVGFIRLPDVYTRSHAGTKNITLGVLFTLAGTFVYFWLAHGVISIRLILGIAFVFITAPVAGHLIARTAYRSGVKLSDSSIKDDLGDDLAKLAKDQAALEKGEEIKTELTPEDPHLEKDRQTE